MRKILAVVVILIALIGIFFGARGYFAGELRKQVLAQLNDPDSALFRNEKFKGPWSVADSTLCGEVNAKNKMGGYVGYKKFYVALGSIVDIDADEEMYEIMCERFDNETPWWWINF